MPKIGMLKPVMRVAISEGFITASLGCFGTVPELYRPSWVEFAAWRTSAFACCSEVRTSMSHW
jgi:hypothetical protein